MFASITPPVAMRAQLHSNHTLSPLERLPLLILDQICELLAAKTRHICAFGLASHHCAFVSRRHRLARIHLRVTKALPRFLDDLCRTLGPTVAAKDGCARYVRHLTITQGKFQPEVWPEDDRGVPAERCQNPHAVPDPFHPSWQHVEARKEWLQDDFKELYLSYPPELIVERDNLWLPLAQCIRSMLCLADLVYSCDFPMPTCLLRALHEKQSFTRLHITAFGVESLLRSRDSVGVDTSNQMNLDWKLVGRMISGAANNFKSVLTGFDGHDSNQALHDAHRGPPPMVLQREGFDTKEDDLNPTCKGHSVNLVCTDWLYVNLETWATIAYLEELTALTIGTAFIDTVRSLTELARNSTFQALQTLDLGLVKESEEPGDGLDAAGEIELEASALMRTLRPLGLLALRGDIGGETLLQAILDKHGKTVTKLQLVATSEPQEIFEATPAMNFHSVACIGRQCPHLEHLEIYIRRTNGDHEELGIYQALGEFPRLQSISLRMDCAYLFEAEMECYKRNSADILREALGNCAVDAQLALAIFRAITANTHSKLNYLKIQVDDIPDYDSDWYTVMEWLAQNWVCERDSPGENGRLRVWRVANDWRPKSFGRDCSILENNFHGVEGIREDIKAAWTSFWPGEGPDWRRQWTSLPLSQIDRGTIA